MDIFFVVLGLTCVCVGVLGSFMPVLPGLPISWVGLLLLHFTSIIPINYMYLGIWLVIAIMISILDYIIPVIGAKKYGGSKYGMWGTTFGLIVGIFFPPLGFIIGPFLGAYIGEMIYQNNSKIATRAAWGSLMGFLASTFMKFIFGIVYIGLFVAKLIEYKEEFFN